MTILWRCTGSTHVCRKITEFLHIFRKYLNSWKANSTFLNIWGRVQIQFNTDNYLIIGLDLQLEQIHIWLLLPTNWGIIMSDFLHSYVGIFFFKHFFCHQPMDNAVDRAKCNILVSCIGKYTSRRHGFLFTHISKRPGLRFTHMFDNCPSSPI